MVEIPFFFERPVWRLPRQDNDTLYKTVMLYSFLSFELPEFRAILSIPSEPSKEERLIQWLYDQLTKLGLISTALLLCKRLKKRRKGRVKKQWRRLIRRVYKEYDLSKV